MTLFFSAALRRAADQALATGDIDQAQHDCVLDVIRHPRRRDRRTGRRINALREVNDHANAMLVGDGLSAAPVTAWGDGTFLDWLMQNLPSIIEFIMKLVALFGSVDEPTEIAAA